MRTKQIKVGDKLIDAVLMAGGPGFKIYSVPEGVLLMTGKKQHLIKEHDTDFKPVMNYVNLRYQPASKQEEIKKEFDKLIKTKVSGGIMYKSLNDAEIHGEGYGSGRTEIWYMKNSRFGTEGVTKEDLHKTHVLLGKIKEHDPEKIYHMMQGDFWSPKGEARDLIKSKGLNHTSMSVGDVIKIGDKVEIVDDMGFKVLAVRKAIQALKIGASVVLATDYDKGDPMELVKNPNPNGNNKMITRKAAQQWLMYNKPGAQPIKSKKPSHEFTKQPYHSI